MQASLAEFLDVMDNCIPTIPEQVTNYYLQRTGFVTEDRRLIRIISLAAHKFVADVASDAMATHRIRGKGEKRDRDGNPKVVLTMDDLSASLQSYGVNIVKPDFYADSDKAARSKKSHSSSR